MEKKFGAKFESIRYSIAGKLVSYRLERICMRSSEINMADKANGNLVPSVNKRLYDKLRQTFSKSLGKWIKQILR